MKGKAVIICFIWPLICACLNIQLLTGVFISLGVSQLIAYSNVLLIMLGVLVIMKDPGELSKTAKLWFVFYILYYSFSLLASGINGFENPDYSMIATIVPVIYFVGFYYFLRNETYTKMFFKVITICYVISALLTIFFFKINYDFDDLGIRPYALDRAGGVYADANNAAMVSILAFVLFQHFYIAKNKIQKVFKIFLLLVIVYSILITLSTTGLFIFVLVFIITNYKSFKGLRLLLLGVLLMLFYAALFARKQFYGHFNLSVRQIGKIDNIYNVLTFNTAKIDSSGRSELLQHLLHYVYQNPIFGNGIGFSTYIRGHNTFIGVWADAGIITFLFFLALLILYIVKSLKLNITLAIFCLSMLVTMYIFMLTLQTVINQTYIIVLFVFIAYIIDRKKLI
ncbi:O-antigen ligase family protein [Formosa sp. L2A11]|uniref:O-antigen ligase family protein n=1 Tax=Formosa sp. L2A11 TaxID=2686363 RepID=UPI00131B2C40|nr:O-antigen ligase family protein [Formosa sp. L2A11]